jgi:hypothetical protein
MRKIYSFLIAVLVTAIGWGQSPQKMSYQAVIRNSNNQLVTNHEVGIRVSILQGSTTGTEVYKEIFNPNPQTNADGLVTIEIGGGTPITGTFAAIDWSAGMYFIKTETDPTGGTNYTITGTSQLLSVPYALYAKTASNVDWSVNSLTFPQGISKDFVSFTLGPGLNYTVPSGKNIYILQSGGFALVNGKRFVGQNFLFTENTVLVWDEEYNLSDPIYCAFIGFLTDKTATIEPITFTLTNSNSYVVPSNKILILKSWQFILSITVNGITGVNRDIGVSSTFMIFPANTELITPDATEERGYTGYLINM